MNTAYIDIDVAVAGLDRRRVNFALLMIHLVHTNRKALSIPSGKLVMLIEAIDKWGKLSI